jgi:hypothetical protein
MHRLTRLLPLGLAAIALLSAGCGDNGERTTTALSATDSKQSFLGTGGLERGLGNAFRAGLYRLAVMSQPPDGATDLGQDLPTGVLHGVSCATDSRRRGAIEVSSCTVRWRTVAGRSRLTRYVVRRYPTGCFAAGAQPRYPNHRDPTIESYSEHPLNALVSVGEDC